VSAQLRVRALTLQLVSQEKAAVIGTMAAGVAHEVRNPLNALLNAARVLLEERQPKAARDELLGVIIDGAQRIDGIVGALDEHARPAERRTERPYDLRAGLDATLRLLAHRLGATRVHRDYRTTREAMVEVGPINQVFLNLIDNAARTGAGQIWVRLTEDSSRLVVAIEDDGPGVPPTMVGKIFDPFFTTRDPGEGSGLGLHLSRQIVAQHGGTLRYEAREHGGACFVADLPAVPPSQRESLVS